MLNRYAFLLISATVLAACCNNEHVNPVGSGGGGAEPYDAGPDVADASGGGGTGGAAPTCPDICKPPMNPCDFATCDALNKCLMGHMPKGTDCGPMMACDGFGTCGPAPVCSTSTDCDDGDPCTNDTCYTFTGQCGHGPAGGHTPCPGGYCNDGATSCCPGCNLAQGSGFVCVGTCPGGAPCTFGFCPPA